MAKDDLTKRQRQILEYIRTCIQENQCPPSVREIGNAIGLSSPSTVHAHLNALEAKGYIKRASSKSRAMSVTSKGSHSDIAKGEEETSTQPESSPVGAVSGTYKTPSADSSVVVLPYVGRVAAGAPILAEQNIEEEIPLPTSLFGDRNSFLLRVHGNSMVEAGIFDGDTVIVRSQQTADNGAIVVALIDGEATVKTFYREKNRIRLQPQNHTMEPIYARDVQIAGVVTGLFRSY